MPQSRRVWTANAFDMRNLEAAGLMLLTTLASAREPQ
jgi:hypothetical protein